MAALLAALVPAGPVQSVTLPGVNGLVAIARSSTGPTVALNPDTGVATSLLFGAGRVTPEVSPNGQRVAYVNSGTGDIRIADWPSGNNEQQVTTTTVSEGSPTWTPDGSTLFFQCSSGLCSAPAAANAPVTALTGSVAFDGDPDVSPNGQFVVTAAVGGVVRINANGTGGRTTLAGSANVDGTGSTQSVSPDGSRVYYECATGICFVPFPNGGSSSTLAGTEGTTFSPMPSPDGTKVLFQDCSFATAGCGDGADGLYTVLASGVGGKAAVPGTVAGDSSTADALHWSSTSASGAPAPTNAAPVFSADSACGGSSILRLIPLFGAGTAGVSASDSAGQVVTLAALGAPSYVVFTSTPGNPATGTLSISANPLEFLNLLVAALLQTPSTVSVAATDNGTPVASATCAKTVRVGIV